MESGGSFHGYHQMNNHPTINLNLNNSDNNNKNKAAATRVGEEEGECKVREQDRYMPIANVIRIMRKMVPPHAKISDDAKETVQECVSEFIGFVTGEANERCHREQRKTITAEDILYAMSKLGFDSYVDPLSLFLHRYRQLESGATTTRSAAYAAFDAPPPPEPVVYQPHVAAAGGFYGQLPPPPPPPPYPNK